MIKTQMIVKTITNDGVSRTEGGAVGRATRAGTAFPVEVQEWRAGWKILDSIVLANAEAPLSATPTIISDLAPGSKAARQAVAEVKVDRATQTPTEAEQLRAVLQRAAKLLFAAAELLPYTTVVKIQRTTSKPHGNKKDANRALEYLYEVVDLGAGDQNNMLAFITMADALLELGDVTMAKDKFDHAMRYDTSHYSPTHFTRVKKATYFNDFATHLEIHQQ